MSYAFYMDVHIPRAVTDGLRMRGIDVLTAQEDGTTETKDPILLDRATELSRLFVTQDDDFLALAASHQSVGKHFRTVVYARQMGITIGLLISDLETIARTATEAESWNYVFYIPL